MGRYAEVYDAEMLGLLRGLETAIVFQQAMPEGNRMQAIIVLFADSASLVAAITSERPGSNQRTSQKFVEAATHFRNEHRGANIEVTWVPGHMGIAGNDRAGEIAKDGTELEPATETTAWQTYSDRNGTVRS